jgi:hypothetical protein
MNDALHRNALGAIGKPGHNQMDVPLDNDDDDLPIAL